MDRQFVWQGTPDRLVDLSQVEATIFEAHRSYRGKVVVDPYQAAHLVQRLRRRGVSMVEFTSQAPPSAGLRSLSSGCCATHGSTCQTTPVYSTNCPGEAPQESTGFYRIDHANGEHDDSVITSLTLVARRLVLHPMGGTATLHVAEGRVRATRPAAPPSTIGEAAAQEIAKARRLPSDGASWMFRR